MIAKSFKTAGPLGRHSLAALVLLVCLSFWAPATTAGPQIDPTEAHRRAQAGEITLIDVRAPREWRETGTPEHALLITMHGENGVDGFVSAVKAAVDGDRSKPVALICAAGGRSSRLQSQLKKQGFSNVIDVSEGVVGGLLSKGWRGRSLPLIGYEQ